MSGIKGKTILNFSLPHQRHIPDKHLFLPVRELDHGLPDEHGRVQFLALRRAVPADIGVPGGKIEMGESPEEALARELREELGIEAEIGQLKIACTHSYGEVGILILFYEVLFWKGEPKTQHHTQLEWIKSSELPNKNIPDANRRNLKRIYQAFNLPTEGL